MQFQRFSGRHEVPEASRGTVREGGGVSTPRGTCPECGAAYAGWALLQPEHQTCRLCDAALDIVTPSTRPKPDSGRKPEDEKGA